MRILQDGSVRIELSEALAPGEHKGLLLLNGAEADGGVAAGELSLPPLPLADWPAGLTFSREDIYEDEIA